VCALVGLAACSGNVVGISENGTAAEHARRASGSVTVVNVDSVYGAATTPAQDATVTGVAGNGTLGSGY